MISENFAPELSIVLLCYKAGDSARTLVHKLITLLNKANISSYELVLVGNYIKDSADITPEVVRKLADEYDFIRAVAKEKEGWMGWDMKTGLEVASGRYIAVTDGDGQMPMEDIVRVYNSMENGKYDMAKTYRVTRGDGLQRKLFSFFYNIIYSTLFPGYSVRDVNSKPKIFTRKAYEKLNLISDDWFIDAEIMIQARRNKFKLVELPTEFLGLAGRRSFVNFKTSFEFVKNLIQHRINEFNR